MRSGELPMRLMPRDTVVSRTQAGYLGKDSLKTNELFSSDKLTPVVLTAGLE